MDGPPRRSTSLNFGLSDLFLGSSYPPTFNLVPNSKVCSSRDSGSLLKFPFPRTQKMSHSMSIDEAVNSISDTKKNFVQSMTGVFGSLKDLVSKIPNFMSNINNPLSVTVVPNEGILSPEDIIQNLTRSSEDLVCRYPYGRVFEKVEGKLQTNSSLYVNERSQISDIFTTKLLPNTSAQKKFKNVDDILVKTWKEDFHCTENNYKPTFMSSINQNNCSSSVRDDYITSKSIDDEKKRNVLDTMGNSSQELDDNLVDIQDAKLVDDLVFIEKFSLDDSSSSDIANDQKTSKDTKQQQSKQYISVKCEFRSRKPSESSTDSDDSCFIIFEDGGSQSDSNYDCESLSDADVDFTDEKEKSDKVKRFGRQCMSVKCDFRSRQISESSIDSESSCFIVFKDEYNDIDCKPSSDDESEEENENDKLGQKVRFNLEPAIHTMIKWDFAYRAARKGPWEEIARDRERFRNKINSLGQVLNPVLTKEHRENVWQIRFAVQD